MLDKNRSRQWFIEAPDQTRLRRNFLVRSYVIMPERVHVVVWPRETPYEVRLILPRKARGLSERLDVEWRNHLVAGVRVEATAARARKRISSAARGAIDDRPRI